MNIVIESVISSVGEYYGLFNKTNMVGWSVVAFAVAFDQKKGNNTIHVSLSVAIRHVWDSMVE